MSVNETPASVERITARPFDRPLPPKTGSSSWFIEPPIQTVSGFPGGDTTNMSYPHWVWQKKFDPNPGVPFVGLDSRVQPPFEPPVSRSFAGALASSVRHSTE